MVKEISENFWDMMRELIRFNLIKSLVKVFRAWRNKETLKMECNKRNRYNRYAIFRDSNLKKLSDILFCNPTFSSTFVIDLAN